MQKHRSLKSSVEQFSYRPIELHPLPLAKGISVLHPESAVIVFDGMAKDVGALCYMRRQSNVAMINRRVRRARAVDLDSLDLARTRLIGRFIALASDLLYCGFTNSTVHGWVGLWIILMDWADENGHPDVCGGGEATYVGFRAYVDYLRHRLDTNQISQRTASSRQFATLRLMERLTGLHDIHRGVRLIDIARPGDSRTTPPSEHDLGRLEGLCDAIFRGHSDLVLEGRKFPYKMEVPKSLAWDRDYVWLFPLNGLATSVGRGENGSGGGRAYAAYDFENGLVATVDEIRSRFNDVSNAYSSIRYARNRLLEANRNGRHPARIAAAVRAHNAFVLLFLGQTGMNISVAFALPWGAEYKVGTSQQGFREIKWRAGGKLVSVVIRNKFLPLFSKFIEIRGYLLDGRECDRLSFGLGTEHRGDPKPMTQTGLESFYTSLQRVDPTIPRIRNRKLRAAKQDYHVRNDDPSVAATIMGHSEETARRHYTAGSESAHHEEISTFLTKVEESALNKRIVLRANELVDGGVPGHLGTCAEFHAPHAIGDAVPVAPDCGRQEGCLFCDKHRVHADAHDVRKLVSCAFVIQQTTYLPGAQTYFEPVLNRISSLLDAVKAFDGMASIVSEIEHEVEEYGQLDAYWAEKWALLNELEVIV
ncbi:hypothetical protein H3V53_14800 [Paraburkholderia bengalensis]|uniref:Phage integrase family protein n=1 Tax=Paraburkholderia bengalensis TaxID=2747562 RepID=A0ABU8IS21_9BURK